MHNREHFHVVLLHIVCFSFFTLLPIRFLPLSLSLWHTFSISSLLPFSRAVVVIVIVVVPFLVCWSEFCFVQFCLLLICQIKCFYYYYYYYCVCTVHCTLCTLIVYRTGTALLRLSLTVSDAVNINYRSLQPIQKEMPYGFRSKHTRNLDFFSNPISFRNVFVFLISFL